MSKVPNPCPYCNNTPTGYESQEALKTHITLFHPNKDPTKTNKEDTKTKQS